MNEKRLACWPDRLRNLATLMVIFIHAAAPIAHAEGADYNGLWWWGGNFWNSLTRPGVPLFVMLSGYLLLGKDYPLPDFLKRRFSRVVVPALFWMLIYSLYGYLAKGTPATIGDTLRGIVTGPVHYHLWFIYLIIGLYLVYPFLRGWVRNATEQEYLYFFVMCAIGTWGYKFLATYCALPIGIYFELFTNNCGYFVLGYYLGTREFNNKKIAWALIATGSAGTMLASYVINTFFWNGQANVYFYDYLTPNVAVSAAGWFLLAKQTFNSRPLYDIEKDFSAASFGIYFAHVLVMDWWGQLGYWHSMAHPVAVAPALAFLVTCMTFLAVALIRTLPGGTKIT